MKILGRFLKWLRGNKQEILVTQLPELDVPLVIKSFAEQLKDCWNPSTTSYLQNAQFLWGRRSQNRVANMLANGEQVGILKREPPLTNFVFDSTPKDFDLYTYSNVECQTPPELPIDAKQRLADLDAALTGIMTAKLEQASYIVTKPISIESPKKKNKSKNKKNIKSKVKNISTSKKKRNKRK